MQPLWGGAVLGKDCYSKELPSFHHHSHLGNFSKCSKERVRSRIYCNHPFAFSHLTINRRITFLLSINIWQWYMKIWHFYFHSYGKNNMYVLCILSGHIVLMVLSVLTRASFLCSPITWYMEKVKSSTNHNRLRRFAIFKERSSIKTIMKLLTIDGLADLLKGFYLICK